MKLERQQCMRIHGEDIGFFCEQNDLSDTVYESLISDYECGGQFLCRDAAGDYSIYGSPIYPLAK